MEFHNRKRNTNKSIQNITKLIRIKNENDCYYFAFQN